MGEEEGPYCKRWHTRIDEFDKDLPRATAVGLGGARLAWVSRAEGQPREMKNYFTNDDNNLCTFSIEL